MRTLIFDIETSPMVAYMWRLWDKLTSMDFVIEDGRILCWAAKWLDEDDVYFASEWEHGQEGMLQGLWDLMDEADVLVAHNGDRFDRPWVNGQFLKYGIEPPSPCFMVDTWKVAKKMFTLPSNRLDALAKLLEVGEKLETGGFQLWKDVLAGDPGAQQVMEDYNIRDITVLEDVYLCLRPWIQNHPNVSDPGVNTPTCPTCGSDHLNRRGYAKTRSGVYQRYRCMDCGGWSRTRYTEVEKNVNRLTQDATK